MKPQVPPHALPALPPRPHPLPTCVRLEQVFMCSAQLCQLGLAVRQRTLCRVAIRRQLLTQRRQLSLQRFVVAHGLRQVLRCGGCGASGESVEGQHRCTSVRRRGALGPGDRMGALGPEDRKGALGQGDMRGALGPGDRRAALGPGDRRRALGPGDRRGALGPGDRRGALGPGDRKHVGKFSFRGGCASPLLLHSKGSCTSQSWEPTPARFLAQHRTA
eukprot:355194-Chlamydomonas_euryale.AAC.4